MLNTQKNEIVQFMMTKMHVTQKIIIFSIFLFFPPEQNNPLLPEVLNSAIKRS